jgi:hypothetical protein
MCAHSDIRICPRHLAASHAASRTRPARAPGPTGDEAVPGGAADLAGGDTLRMTCWAEHNRRFAQPAASAEDFHVPVPRGVSLAAVFRLRETRTVSNDWVVRYANRYLQIVRQSRRPPARDRRGIRNRQRPAGTAVSRPGRAMKPDHRGPRAPGRDAAVERASPAPRRRRPSHQAESRSSLAAWLRRTRPATGGRPIDRGDISNES